MRVVVEEARQWRVIDLHNRNNKSWIQKINKNGIREPICNSKFFDLPLFWIGLKKIRKGYSACGCQDFVMCRKFAQDKMKLCEIFM